MEVVMISIYTGSYENCKNGKTFSISGDAGKSCGYEGNVIRELAPKKVWWQKWHDNVGKVSEDENLRFYVESYYETVLKSLSPSDILNKLSDGSILLCYEKPQEFCHRQIVAIWLELFFNIEVREVCVLEDGTLKVFPRNRYRTVIREMLEPLIKDNMDMNGHSSIAVAYAYKRAERMFADPELCKRLGFPAEMFLRIAENMERQLEGTIRKEI